MGWLISSEPRQAKLIGLPSSLALPIFGLLEPTDSQSIRDSYTRTMFVVLLQFVCALALLSVSAQAVATNSLNPGTCLTLANSPSTMITGSAFSCTTYPDNSVGSSYTAPVRTYWTPSGPDCPTSATYSAGGVTVYIMPGTVPDVSSTSTNTYSWAIPSSNTAVCNAASTNFAKTMGNYFIMICNTGGIATAQGSVYVTATSNPPHQLVHHHHLLPVQQNQTLVSLVLRLFSMRTAR